MPALEALIGDLNAETNSPLWRIFASNVVRTLLRNPPARFDYPLNSYLDLRIDLERDLKEALDTDIDVPVSAFVCNAFLAFFNSRPFRASVISQTATQAGLEPSRVTEIVDSHFP